MRELYNDKRSGENLGITDRMVVYHWSPGRIKGAKKMENTWFVPADTEKPSDGRYRSIKVKDGENK